MSSQSRLSEANETYLSSKDGSASTADESSARESPVAQTTERRTRKAKQAENPDSGRGKTKVAQRSQSQSRQRMRSKPRRISKQRRNAYQSVLTQAIDQVSGSYQDANQPLPPSRIGGSVWSSLEKGGFFAALALYGQDDLPKIRDAIPTKSLTEIRAYLLLLQRETHHTDRHPRLRDLGLENVSASAEISEECDDALEHTADDVAIREMNLSIEEEKQHYGDYWLIDESIADAIERSIAKPASGDETSSDVSASARSSSAPDATSRVKSAELLIPTNILLLSHNIFMDGHPPHNWRTTETLDHEIASTPAIWQSALDHLYEITTAKMRELIRASLLQATSRLRFTDGNDYAPVVADHDVTTAAKLLKLKSWDEYWATFPRRSGFHVYSDDRQYKDGRAGTKNGVKLTHDEVAYELGMDVPPKKTGAKSKEAGEEESHSVSSDSDSFEDTATETSSDSLENPEQKEEHYLEAIDQQSSRGEQRRLFDVLGLKAAQDDDGTEIEGEAEGSRKRPSKRKRKEAELQMMQWRKRMRYEPEWVTKMQNSVVQEEDDV